MNTGNSSNNNNNTKPRRKKATRACSHCQKAHLTCDDSRPCQRCIKRGLESTCTDGVRKRAKYLQDDEYEKNQQAAAQQQQQLPPTFGHDFSTNGFDPQLLNVANNYGFGSESANLEYGILSNMLQLNGALEPSSMPYFSSAAAPFNLAAQQSSDSGGNILSSSSSRSNADSMPSLPTSTPTPTIHNVSSSSSMYSLQPAPAPIFSSSTPSPSKDSVNKVIKRRKGVGNTPEETYNRVKAPFNYAEGYHYLFQHVRQRMSREDLMRICRALALFRPSFISAMIHLTEEDLIYMEKCVQRTLLEYEKLISFSGTPTAVWRRTGEIVLVGKEFSLLTQWSKETLLGKKTFIYELMDNGSAVEYWEKYAQHAFSDTESSVYMSVILMSPTFRPVPCSFCFTIKRDIFDLPSVIVGNFLPILSGSSFQ